MRRNLSGSRLCSVFVLAWSCEPNSISPLCNLIWTNGWFWLKGPCDSTRAQRASPCTVDLCTYQIKNSKHTLTSMNASALALLLVCILHTHTHTLMHHIATETGNFLADPSFMCVDLSSAIKIYLIFTEMALYCWLLTSPSRLLQPLALTFSPAHKTPASSSTSGRSRSSLPSISPTVSLHLLWPLLWFYLYRVCLCFSSSCPCPLLSPSSSSTAQIPSPPLSYFFLIVSFPPEWSIRQIYLTFWEWGQFSGFYFKPPRGLGRWTFLMSFHEDIQRKSVSLKEICERWLYTFHLLIVRCYTNHSCSFGWDTVISFMTTHEFYEIFY